MPTRYKLVSSKEFCDQLVRQSEAQFTPVDAEDLTDLEFGLVEIAALVTIVSGTTAVAKLIFDAYRDMKCSPDADPVTVTIQGPFKQVTIALTAETNQEDIEAQLER